MSSVVHIKPSQCEPLSKRVRTSLQPAEIEQPTSNNSSPSSVSSQHSANALSSTFIPPMDWPAIGSAIDLKTADLPHDSADTEWWYINGHVKNESNGHDLSFFASFFRVVKSIHADGSLEHAHALNWAIVDATNKQYYADPVLDRATPEILKRQLMDGSYDLDERMRRAFMEIVAKGQHK